MSCWSGSETRSEVDTAAILLLDAETDELVARAAKGIEEEVEQGVRVPLGIGFAGRIAAGRIAIFMPEVSEADIHNPILREKGIRSMLGVPLIVESELIGVLHVGSLTPTGVRAEGSGRPPAGGGADRAGHRTRATVLGPGARAPRGHAPAAKPASARAA